MQTVFTRTIYGEADCIHRSDHHNTQAGAFCAFEYEFGTSVLDGSVNDNIRLSISIHRNRNGTISIASDEWSKLNEKWAYELSATWLAGSFIVRDEIGNDCLLVNELKKIY